MLLNEFSPDYFKPQTDEQQGLLRRFLQIRHLYGEPSRILVLRGLARTRPFTKSIYPPNWKIM
jgi:hypothetical protein